ncbi:transglutaminase-like domain-containing protein [Prevotella sp.]|uniref:transglutaminase-like domain-containing protein n=1 Tax=Prevotella sp. TaxID=59823 RepID=UPI002648245B|nr:transglutaminase-like domain-containing protein [Prevotella sp.]MDN5552828.1 transglutaminase-like domain-containing protein [Prevotella sp.]
MEFKKRNILIAIVIILLAIHSNNTNAQTTTQDSIVCAQFDQDLKTFSIGIKELEKSNKKDYIAISKLYNNILTKYESLPTPLQKKYDNIRSLYYNSACYNVRSGNKKKALAHFEKVADYGKDNYSWAKVDSDLLPLHKYERFKKALVRLAEKTDYLGILKASQAYTADKKEYQFKYANPNDTNLVRLRTIFNLDSIAGCGNEIAKIKNIMYWVHDIVSHDGSSNNPAQKNAIDIIRLCQKEKRGVNCRMMAQILNECYLAMGFKARYVTCLPKVMINDCHVINVVYSCTLNKWIWMDPTFAAYVTDDKGMLLSIQEVRERLRMNLPLVLNDDANWNHKSKQTKENYLDYYMTKNLYHLECINNTGFNTETYIKGTTDTPEYKLNHYFVDLCPQGYQPDNKTKKSIVTTDDQHFWESPYKN